MTEVISPESETVEAQYFDGVGNPIASFEEYLELEAAEASRYIENLSKGLNRTPSTVMCLIAAVGKPALSDFDIRFKTYYVRKDNMVLDAVLLDLQQAELLTLTSQKTMSLPKSVQKTDRPTSFTLNYYDLLTGAYERIPGFTEIATRRQVKPRRFGRSSA